MMPNLMALPKDFQNFSYFSFATTLASSSSFSLSSSSESLPSSASLRIISNAFLTSFFLIVFKEVCCCNVSRETFNGSVSESTIPLIKERYFGKSSSNSSEMNTLLTYSFNAEALP